jgi:hypothetical protein
MSTKPWRFAMAAMAIVLGGCASMKVLPGHSVVLPEKATTEVANQCSRPGPPKFEATWTPSRDIVPEMEAGIDAVRSLRAGCCIRGQRITSLDGYYLQYVGIVVNDRKLIYVNAFWGSPSSDAWLTRPEMYCDGGSGSWGVVYDPERRVFYELHVNGSA